MSTTLPQKVATALKPKAKADLLLGINLLEIDEGYARMQMVVTDDHCNFAGSIHGGIIFTLADSAFAYACNSQNIATVAAGCSIEYLAPAFPGDSLTATAKYQGGRGKQGIYDIEINNQDNKLIACFRGKSHSSGKTLVGEIND